MFTPMPTRAEYAAIAVVSCCCCRLEVPVVLAIKELDGKLEQSASDNGSAIRVYKVGFSFCLFTTQFVLA